MATTRRTTLGQQMARQERARANEEERAGAAKRIHVEEAMRKQMEDDEKVEEKRMLRRMMTEQKEREMEDSILRAKRNKDIREFQQAQEERIAKELERVKYEKVRDEKMRQHIRETSLELRELEAKLKAGYVNKERHAQLAEKEAVKYDEMARDAEIARLMKAESERAAEADRALALEAAEERIRYQAELERQLEEQETAKQRAYEEFLKEKLMIDEIVRKIYEEDAREREIQMEKQRLTKQYIEEFKAVQDEWKKAEKARMEEENKNILKFANLQQEREEAAMEEKKAREAALEQVQQRLGNEIARQERDREEMERVRQELVLEEEEDAARQKEKDAVERRIRERVEQREVYRQQMAFKNLRLEAEKDEEEEFKKQMLAKFAEDDRIELMNAQRRRMKQQEHKRAVEALLGERREQFAAEKERDLAERHHAEGMENFRKQIIEEERQRLLQEHASKLLGYLPKGVIKDSGDLGRLGPDFQEAYRERHFNPLDDSGSST